MNCFKNVTKNRVFFYIVENIEIKNEILEERKRAVEGFGEWKRLKKEFEEGVRGVEGLVRSREQWMSEIEGELMRLSMEEDGFLVRLEGEISRERMREYTELREKVRWLEAMKLGLRDY